MTQKHYRVKNPGQNPNWLHEPQAGPASAPGAPRHAQASPGRAPRAPTPCASRPHAVRLARPALACCALPPARLPRAPAPASRVRASPVTPCSSVRARPRRARLHSARPYAPAHSPAPARPLTLACSARPARPARTRRAAQRPAPCSTTYCSMISNLLHQIFFFFFMINIFFFFLIPAV